MFSHMSERRNRMISSFRNLTRRSGKTADEENCTCDEYVSDNHYQVVPSYFQQTTPTYFHYSSPYFYQNIYTYGFYGML